jgi:hypothetical protein
MNEQEHRRPDFIGGEPIRMADGNEWILPRPLAWFVMDDDESGVNRQWNLGSEYGALLEAQQDAFNATRAGEDDPVERVGNFRKWVASEIRIARWLLLKNYNLTKEQVNSLVRFGYSVADDPEAVALREAVMDLAFGMTEPPKTNPVGSD